MGLRIGHVGTMAVDAVRLVLIPAMASLMVSWWVIGDVSEGGGTDTILNGGWPEANAATVGWCGIAVVALIAIDQLRTWRSHDRRRRVETIGLASTIGLAAAFSLRVITARTGGANIGGAAIMMIGPFVAAPLLVFAVLRAIARPTRPARRPANQQQR